MSVLEKFVGGLVAIGLFTTLVLPKRQTPAVLKAGSGLINGAFSTVLGTNTKV